MGVGDAFVFGALFHVAVGEQEVEDALVAFFVVPFEVSFEHFDGGVWVVVCIPGAGAECVSVGDGRPAPDFGHEHGAGGAFDSADLVAGGSPGVVVGRSWESSFHPTIEAIAGLAAVDFVQRTSRFFNWIWPHV